MTNQILTPACREYSLSEPERLALLPTTRKSGVTKRLKMLPLSRQEIKQVFNDVSNFFETDHQPVVNLFKGASND